MTPAVVHLACRTSDRTAGGGRGAAALAPLLAERCKTTHRTIGSAKQPKQAPYDEDLRESRGCLLEAGGQIDDALAAGRFPILLASDCSICVSTLPAVIDREPEAWILWLDAHGDFNTPETSPSGFLGGMCLAAACGRWDAGFPGSVDPARVVQCGVRDLDGGERVELERAGVVRIERPSRLADALDAKRVFVHLDLDVLDPSIHPAQFAVPGGFSDSGLRNLLQDVSEACDVIGCEITAFELPEGGDDALTELIASVIDPLLPPVG